MAVQPIVAALVVSLVMGGAVVAQVEIAPTAGRVQVPPEETKRGLADVEPTVGQRSDVVAFLLAKRESLHISLAGKRARLAAAEKMTAQLLAEAQTQMKTDNALAQYN
jgi:hypothetical protein